MAKSPMKKKTAKPAKKQPSKGGKNSANRPDLSPEIQEELRIGRELMAQYEKTFKDLAKS